MFSSEKWNISSNVASLLYFSSAPSLRCAAVSLLCGFLSVNAPTLLEDEDVVETRSLVHRCDCEEMLLLHTRRRPHDVREAIQVKEKHNSLRSSVTASFKFTLKDFILSKAFLKIYISYFVINFKIKNIFFWCCSRFSFIATLYPCVLFVLFQVLIPIWWPVLLLLYCCVHCKAVCKFVFSAIQINCIIIVIKNNYLTG